MTITQVTNEVFIVFFTKWNVADTNTFKLSASLTEIGLL